MTGEALTPFHQLFRAGSADWGLPHQQVKPCESSDADVEQNMILLSSEYTKTREKVVRPCFRGSRCLSREAVPWPQV